MLDREGRTKGSCSTIDSSDSEVEDGTLSVRAGEGLRRGVDGSRALRLHLRRSACWRNLGRERSRRASRSTSLVMKHEVGAVEGPQTRLSGRPERPEAWLLRGWFAGKTGLMVQREASWRAMQGCCWCISGKGRVVPSTAPRRRETVAGGQRSSQEEYHRTKESESKYFKLKLRSCQVRHGRCGKVA